MKKKIIISAVVILAVVSVLVVKGKFLNTIFHNENRLIESKSIAIGKKMYTQSKFRHSKKQDDEYGANYFVEYIYLDNAPIKYLKPSNIQSYLGVPLSITNEFSEFDNANVTVYKYPGSEITFAGNVLLGIDLNDSDLSSFNFYSITPIGSSLIQAVKKGSDLHPLFVEFGFIPQSNGMVHIAVISEEDHEVKTMLTIVFDNNLSVIGASYEN